MERIIQPASALRGEITVPGDKSISHRAVMFGALANGITHASNFLMSADCLSTIACFEQMGIEIRTDQAKQTVTVHGRGLHGLKSPKQPLDAGNSGTTTRLMSGILAGQPFASILDGDASLRRRPMKRVIDPLSQMGSVIASEYQNDCLPLHIAPAAGNRLHAITYRSPVASAQVKSCVLLAGLYADGETGVLESALSRDHTERMLRGFGAQLSSEKDPDTGLWKASIRPEPKLSGQEIAVPGDISSAAYFLAAGLIVPGSEILIRNVGINPTRAGILEVIRAMGGSLILQNERLESGEPVADLLVRHSELTGTVVGGELIPALIDELPVIAVMAAFAKGETIIQDAAELRVKESDRIETTTAALQAMGADITPTPDGMIIRGGAPVRGAVIDSCKDHRIAMSMAVAGLAAEGETGIIDADCVNISYPGFYDALKSLVS